MYAVEAEFIDRVVAQYGPCESYTSPWILPFIYNIILFIRRSATQVGAIVSGQTSVKASEKIAFEKYLPEGVHIVSCHSLHGPTVSPLGQPLVGNQPTNQSTVLLLLIRRARSSSNIAHQIHLFSL